MARKAETVSRFEQIQNIKHSMIDNFPKDTIVIIANSPLTKTLIEQLSTFDAIDTIMRNSVGSEIDIKEFAEYMETLNEYTDYIKKSNEKYLKKIAEVDAFFQKTNTGKVRAKLKGGVVQNKFVRKQIEAIKKEMLPNDDENQSDGGSNANTTIA